MTKTRQTAIGLLLAAAIMGSWLFIHVYAVFFFRLTPPHAWAMVPLMAVEVWLGSGMFIVAHDAMHGSLSPRWPGLNRWIGRLALGLYAGFPYDTLESKHHAHHRHAGGAGDPDFHCERPRAFWPWYSRFFFGYFGVAQFAGIFAVVLIYELVLKANVVNVILFWAAPSILSSVQLFMFGTWLPHRHRGGDGFPDRHNARTLEYSWLLSLLTCYHFGYHLEHHRSPGTPWWALPQVRSRRRAKAFVA